MFVVIVNEAIDENMLQAGGYVYFGATKMDAALDNFVGKPSPLGSLSQEDQATPLRSGRGGARPYRRQTAKAGTGEGIGRTVQPSYQVPSTIRR
jgi:hypothetical protein